MSYAIIRNANHKMNAVPLLERHNERRNKNYSNKDIDLSRLSENFHLKKIEAATYQQEFERIRQKHNLKGNLRLTGEKQSNVMCEFVITSDKEFFNRLGVERTKQFFADAYNFVTAKVGENFVVSAVVHMDEATPHMHVTYIPVINGKDRGNPCKRINCSEFWKGRDSYSRLQDEYYDFITARGYDLERGVKGSTAEHLSVAEFKLKKIEEQLAEITAQISEVESVDEIRSANLPLNKVAINKSDYENLISTAKHYVSAQKAEEENISLRAENLSLKNKNEELRKENTRISNQLHTLEYKFDEFYFSVEDEVALRNENAKLKSENARIGHQVHTLTAEIISIKEERETLSKTVAEKSQEVSELRQELTETKSLLSSLREKFDRVMRFIESLNLRKRLEEFLKPSERKR
ncbi:MAG: plasmid recombination protein [Oscillospiraceae bacterium]|nr:plasmid recombination protein [Oscillospiraceae bacterium]